MTMEPETTLNGSISGLGDTAMRFGDSIKVSVTMPVTWMGEGFSAATARLRDALAFRPATEAKDLTIALVEAVTWLDILQPRLGSAFKSSESTALLFMRARSHHHFASAAYFDLDSDCWRWQPVEVLPDPRRENYPGDDRGEALFRRHLNASGRRSYRQRFARRPVSEAFDRIEDKLAGLIPLYTRSTASGASARAS